MDWKKYWEQIKNTFASLDRRQRIFVLLGGLLTAGVISALAVFATKTQYGVLFGGLDAAEAGLITAKLNEDNVKYRLENGGTTILVPKSKVYDLRLQLASQGLPQAGSIGYEIFDRNNIGSTDFIQKVNYRRAMEGELGRTITTMDKIKSVRVHLVVPDEKLFEADQKETTASITLRLKPGRRLSPRESQAIANLVAASVEGLSPDNVTIVDSHGNILSQPRKSNSLLGLSTDQVELQHRIEEYYIGKVESILESVLGSGRSAVQVSADLNFDQVERTKEQFDPDNFVIISQQKSSQVAEAGQGTSPDKTDNVITNYETNKTVEHIVEQVGNVKRLSVAVMVDGKYQLPPGAAEDAAPQFVPLSATELDQLSDIVKKTVGFSALRQDEVSVVNMPFDRTSLQADLVAMNDMERGDFWRTWAARVVYGVIIMLIGFGLWKFGKSFQTILTPRTRAPSLSLHAGADGEPINFELSSDIKNNARLQQTISSLTREKPDEAAKLLKAWLVEGSHE